MSAVVRQFEARDLEEVRGIFFESSSKKTFKDDAEKEAFFHKYLGVYLEYFPELALVAIDKRVLGYVVASPVSDGNGPLAMLQPHLKIFSSYFKDYPAHLHINCHYESRGKGIGSKLILETEKRLKILNIKGLHIMTGPDSANQSFYKKLGFDFQTEEPFQGSSILFMGKNLRVNSL
jgi:GNAT superfamily N-acetyltransferase